MSRPRRRARLRPEVLITGSTGLVTFIGGVAGLAQNNLYVAVPALVVAAVLGSWASHRQWKLSQSLAPPAIAAPVTGVAVWNVSRCTETFTGRRAELTALSSSLAAAERIGVVALHGLGGVGKTQVALRYAAEQAAAGAVDTGWFITANSRGYVLDALAELGAELGEAPVAEVEVAARQALRALGRRERWLLIYDDVTDPADLRDLLPVAGCGSVVITSRVTQWAGLAQPQPVTSLSVEAAAAFLGSRLPGADRDAARAVADRLGGLPLALEQAAGFCEATGRDLADYAALFDAPLPSAAE